MRRMYSKKQLEEIISELSGDLVVVKKIKQLSDEQCNNLKVGDVVAKQTGKQYHLYLVTFKQDKGGLCLSYFDASCIETQSYDYTGGHWVYNSEDKTTFADIGVLPDVTAEDNNKVLEVIAGQWAKGGKKVNVIDASDIPNSLTTDFIQKYFEQGFFVNGSYFGLINPIFFPSRKSGSYYYGYAIGKSSNYNLVFKDYIISGTNISTNGMAYIALTTRNITLKSTDPLKYNDKLIPFYPADTNIGTFICRKGTLEWYIPVAVTGITSGDDLTGVQDNLVNAMKDHLDVMINGYMARFEYEDNGYVVYSSKTEADGGVNLQVNMIRLLIASPNTISFNQMKFAPII